MVDVSVALAWFAMSGVSLKWLSALGHRSQLDSHEPETPTREGELLPEELYPLEFTPIYLGGHR
jgi:hypothetical protein